MASTATPTPSLDRSATPGAGGSTDADDERRALRDVLASSDAFSTRLADFVTALKRRDFRSTVGLARETLELVMDFVRRKQWGSAVDLLKALRGLGRRLIAERPLELIVGCMVRRVLYVLREEMTRVVVRRGEKALQERRRAAAAAATGASASASAKSAAAALSDEDDEDEDDEDEDDDEDEGASPPARAPASTLASTSTSASASNSAANSAAHPAKQPFSMPVTQLASQSASILASLSTSASQSTSASASQSASQSASSSQSASRSASGSVSATSHASESSSTAEPPPKRPRGRPRKNPPPSDARPSEARGTGKAVSDDESQSDDDDDEPKKHVPASVLASDPAPAKPAKQVTLTRDEALAVWFAFLEAHATLIYFSKELGVYSFEEYLDAFRVDATRGIVPGTTGCTKPEHVHDFYSIVLRKLRQDQLRHVEDLHSNQLLSAADARALKSKIQPAFPFPN